MTFTPASTYLQDLDAAQAYIGSRLAEDLQGLVRSLRWEVTANPLDAFSCRYGEVKDVALSARIYGHSLAVIVNPEGRRDWSFIPKGGECVSLEVEVQAIAYILAVNW